MKTEPKDSMKSIAVGNLLKLELPPREFVIDPWLRTGETAQLWAATGVGKTWIALSLAMAIAGGGSVWEWKAHKPRKVLLIDGEMNIQDLKDRIQHLINIKAVIDFDIDILSENLIIIARQDQDPDSSFYDLTNPSSQKLVLERMKHEGSEVIFIDNLTTCADSLKDENDATAFKPINNFLLLMKQAKKTAILVHHANKGGRDSRGSSALDTTFEVKLGLLRPQGDAVDMACFKAEFGKLRAKGDKNITSPKLWKLEESGWSVEDDTDTIEQQALEKLKTLDYVNQNELATALGVSQSTTSRIIKKLAAKHNKDLIDGYFRSAREIRANPEAEEIPEYDDY